MTLRTFKPKEIAERYSVGVDKVITWINNDELAAFDVGSKPGSQKPRYRITAAAVEQFEAARAITPLPSRQQRRRRDAAVTEYF